LPCAPRSRLCGRDDGTPRRIFDNPAAFPCRNNPPLRGAVPEANVACGWNFSPAFSRPVPPKHDMILMRAAL
jgi:hypothetical protein